MPDMSEEREREQLDLQRLVGIARRRHLQFLSLCFLAGS